MVNETKGSVIASVVIPAHNAERYLGTAIESVLAQSLQELEVIVVDDASTDGTASIVRSISDRRVRLLRSEENVGPAASRNRGFDEARGKWVSILDADDWMAPERLETLIEMAECHDLDIAADNLYIVDGDVPLSYDQHWHTVYQPGMDLIDDSRDVELLDFIRGNFPGPACRRYGLIKPVFRKSTLEKLGLRYPEQFRQIEDVAFYIRCLDAGARLRVTPQAYYYYRYHEDQISKASGHEIFVHHEALISDLKPHFKACGNVEAARALTELYAAVKIESRYVEMMRALKARSYREALPRLARRPQFLFQKRTLHTIYLLMKGFQF